MKCENIVDLICVILVILGALNISSAAIFGIDYIGIFFGISETGDRLFRAMIGLSGLWVGYRCLLGGMSRI